MTLPTLVLQCMSPPAGHLEVLLRPRGNRQKGNILTQIYVLEHIDMYIIRTDVFYLRNLVYLQPLKSYICKCTEISGRTLVNNKSWSVKVWIVSKIWQLILNYIERIGFAVRNNFCLEEEIFPTEPLIKHNLDTVSASLYHLKWKSEDV